MSDNPIKIALREVFGPLVKQSSKLPAPLAYGLSITVAIIVMVILGGVVSRDLLLLLAVLIFASLAAFVFTDWHTRRYIEPTTISGRSVDTDERIIYDSTKGNVVYDFRGVGHPFYRVEGNTVEEISPEGLGTLKFEAGGILNIERTNTEGRYSIWLLRYSYEGSDTPCIPKNMSIPGDRYLRASCEAIVARGEHTLRFVLKNEETKEWLAKGKVRITNVTKWTQIDLPFVVTPTLDCRLRIDDVQVSQAPSSIQIRNLVLAEKAL